MVKKIKKFFNNKPWKDVKTRKITFIISLLLGILAILFGAWMIYLDKFDSATWLSETLDFFKWVITTGVVVIAVDKTSDVIKVYHNVDINEHDEED